MHNCLILGSGRSGTSMVAGTLSKAGYFMGEHFPRVRHSNPKGFFEDREINEINEQILSLVDLKNVHFFTKYFIKTGFKQHTALSEGHRWLARVPFDVKIASTPEIIERIKKATERTPFCFKDPRFSYTLPVWRPCLENTVFICVFRDPPSTAQSIVKECGDIAQLRKEKMDFQTALEIWFLMYQHILQAHRQEGKWLFIHFDQVLTKEGLDRIESFTGASVDRSFPESSLRRSYSDAQVPKKMNNIYCQLCDLAGYRI